jgi:limonene-1,2-epoxide hydrolase
VTGAEVAAAFWDALYDRDWARIAGFFTEESVYWDVPTGPGSAAKGPKGIVARLQLGLEGLSGYEHTRGDIVSDPVTGFTVTEHAETWHWSSGECVTLPFVSVQRIEGEHILVWRDYWDLQTLMGAAPEAWHHRLDTADLWWLHDASGVA